MGVSTKGEGHYLWISGTLGVIGQITSMMYGLHARVGGGKPIDDSVFCFRKPARGQPPVGSPAQYSSCHSQRNTTSMRITIHNRIWSNSGLLPELA